MKENNIIEEIKNSLIDTYPNMDIQEHISGAIFINTSGKIKQDFLNTQLSLNRTNKKTIFLVNDNLAIHSFNLPHIEEKQSISLTCFLEIGKGYIQLQKYSQNKQKTIKNSY